MNPQYVTSIDARKIQKIMNKYTVEILQILLPERKKGLYNIQIMKMLSDIFGEPANKQRIYESITFLRELKLIEVISQKPLLVRIHPDVWDSIDGMLRFDYSVANFGESLERKQAENHERRKIG